MAINWEEYRKKAQIHDDITEYNELVTEYNQISNNLSQDSEKWHDGDYFSSNSQRLAELDKRKSYLEKKFQSKKDMYTPDFLNEMSESFKKISETSSILQKNNNSVGNYFSQWENEEAYNEWLQTEKEKEKYSAMSLEEIDSEIELLIKEEEAFKDDNGGKFLNYLKKAGSYLSEGKSGVSGSATRAQSQSNIDTLDDFTKEKEILNTYRKQKATEKLLGGLSDEQIGLLDDISKKEAHEDFDELAPAINGLTGTDTTVGYAAATSYERDVGERSRNTLYEQLKEKYPEKTESEVNELIDNMVELRKNQVNEEERVKRDAEMKEISSDNPLSSFLVSRGANILGGTTGLAELYLQRDNEYGYDTNAAGFMLTNDSNTIDEQIQLDHDWVIEIGDAEVDGFDLAYNVGTSVVDNIGRFTMSGGNATASSMMMFAQSTTQSIIDSKEKGYSDEKALTMGLLYGTFEALSEKLSLDIILGSGGSVLRKLAKSFIAEGGEELTSNWLNRIADLFANGKHSELLKKYKAYVSSGYTNVEALTEVACSIIGEDLKTFLIGGLSGFVLGGSANALGAGVNTYSVNQMAKNVTESDIVALQEQARALGVDQSVIDVGTAGPWGGAPSTKKVANLISAIDEKQTTAERQKVIDTAKSYGLNVSLYNTQTESGFNKLKTSVANIERELTARVNEQTDNIYITALADRIQELGESRGKALYIADSYIRSASGQSIDQYREASLDSEAARIAINEFNSSGENTPQWVLEAKEQIENVYDEIQRRYITPVHSDATEKGNAKSTKKSIDNSNDNSNVNSIVKNGVESTENGIDNVPENKNISKTQASAVVNGQSVEVEGIGNVGESGATVIVNGKEVDINDVTFDNPVTQAAYNFAAGMETKQKAEAALTLYNPKFDKGSDFTTAFNEYYNAGLKGIGSFKDIDKYYTFAHNLPVSWRESVFNAGRSNKVYKSGVNKLYKNRNLSKTQKTQLKVLDLLGEKYGISFLVFDSLEDRDEALSGLQIAGTNKVAISLDADGKLYLRTAGHECFHVIEEWNPEAATELTEKVINYLKQTEGYNYSERVQEYGRRYGVDANTSEGLALIHSEMAADSMFDVFSNEKFIKDIVAENRTLVQKIKDFLTDLISELRSMMKHFHASEEMNALREQTKALEDINASFISALSSATETMQKTLQNEQKNNASRTKATENAKNSTQHNGVRYSKKDYFVEDKYFKSVISKWDELTHGQYVKVGTIGNNHPLAKVGMPTGVLRYDVSKLQTNMKIHNDYLTADLLKTVPDIISNPVAISEFSIENTVSVFGNYFVGSSPMMVGITISKDRAGNDITKVRTVNARKDVGSLINDGTILYLNENKKRTQEWFQACGIQVPLGGTHFGFIRSISQKSEENNSKTRKSYKITDTQNSLNDSEGGNVQGKTYNLERVSVIESFKSDGYKGEALNFAIDRFDSKLYSFEGKEYYEKSVELYSKYQKGKANKENFFYNTIAKFEPLKSRPRRAPDYVSRNRYDGKVSSEYWYTKDGVIRGSDHWGEEVASCDWYYGDSYGFASRKGSKRYGFVKWEDIIYKTEAIKTDNRVMLRTFENSVGKGGFVEDGRIYEYNKFDRKYYDAENGKELRRSIKLTQKSQRILDENPEIKNVLQDLQNELSLAKGFVPEGKVIHKYASQLKKDNPCNVSVAEIESDLREIYTVLSSMSGSEGYEYAADLTFSLAIKLIDNSRVLDDLNTEKKELRQRLTSAVKGHKWYLSPEMRSEIEYYYDSYGNFHKKTFGRGFSFSENSTDYLDSDWSELCAAVPELFDSDTPVVEQPLAIVEAFATTEYEFGLFDDNQYYAQAKYIATDIMNNLAAIPEADTLIGKIKSSKYDRIAKLKGENAEKIKDLKQKYTEDIERISAEEKTRYKLQIKQKIEAEKAAKARKYIETTMVRLSGMLAKGTKNRHVPLKLIDTVRDLCYAITLNRASQTELGENIDKIESLYAAFKQGEEDADGETNNQFLKNAYDEYVHDLIRQLGTKLRHKSIGDMTLEELILVDETVKAVAHRVARGNELHIESKNEGIEETAQAISGELGSAKVKRLYKFDKLNKTADKADIEKWKFLKPVYAWRMMGSDTFAELMNNIRKGEDTWAVDIAEAREKILSISEKYHKDKWADDKKELTLASGEKFTFSVQQLMMLYVASQREQYIPHLIGHKRGEVTDSMKGGFVFEDAYKIIDSKELIEDEKGNKKKVHKQYAEQRKWRKRDAGTHHLTESDLDLFAESLTAEQRSYANEMRDYLAKDLAVKGNEITRQLYDINKFVEDSYFPIKVAQEYIDGTPLKENEVHSVLSTSIMKDLRDNANTSILLRDFDDMWAEHVQQMAMFHSFALPLDDFTRVFNSRSSAGSPASIKSRIETACGKGAVSYIENFIKDVNGGVHSANAPTGMNNALSMFKKGAVFASASVAIQQPSAIARALAEVDAKYFAKTTFTKRDYNELMKYAPIARVKSMGFFDNSIGQSTKDWLLSREYKGLKDKAEALFKDGSFRDDVLSKAPEKMDEITWCHLWNAVKAETAAKYNLNGEELLKKSGERFSEVVELTQVYDSVFSKSEYMRSKDTGAKMAMSFMAEPTTALNMLIDAATNMKHGNIKQGGRYVGAFVASVVFNNILKALVTAARDDDEEKTIIEKYISSVVGGTINDLNPLTLLPFVKDVLSIFDGYSVERADMSLIQDLYNAVTSLDSDTKSTYRKIEDTAGALAAFLGLPLKNVMRDFRAAFNLCAGVFGFEKENEDGEKVPIQKSVWDTSGEGIGNALKDEFSEGFLNTVKDFLEEKLFGTAEEQLYNAIKQGDYKAYEKLLKEEYEGDSAKVNAAIRSGLINYDERVTKAAEARRDGNSALHSQCVKGLSADGFSNENIHKAVDKVYNELTDDGEETDTEKAYSLYTYEDLNNAIETGGDVQGIIDDIASAAVQNGKTDEKARENIRNQVTSYWKPLYLEASGYEQEEIKKLLDDTELYSDLDNTLYGWEKDYTTEKYKTRYIEGSSAEKARIISELEATGLYEDAEKTAKGWELAVLKEEYENVTSQTEKERIKAEIWNIGYYKYYSGMINALEKLDS